MHAPRSPYSCKPIFNFTSTTKRRWNQEASLERLQWSLQSIPPSSKGVFGAGTVQCLLQGNLVNFVIYYHRLSQWSKHTWRDEHTKVPHDTCPIPPKYAINRSCGKGSASATLLSFLVHSLHTSATFQPFTSPFVPAHFPSFLTQQRAYSTIIAPDPFPFSVQFSLPLLQEPQMEPGTVAGIALAIVIFLCIICAVVGCFLMKRGKKKKGKDEFDDVRGPIVEMESKVFCKEKMFNV